MSNERLQVGDVLKAAVRALAGDGAQVEEVNQPDDEHRHWRITVSRIESGERVYRVVEVDAVTGEVLSVRCREV